MCVGGWLGSLEWSINRNHTLHENLCPHLHRFRKFQILHHRRRQYLWLLLAHRLVLFDRNGVLRLQRPVATAACLALTIWQTEETMSEDLDPRLDSSSNSSLDALYILCYGENNARYKSQAFAVSHPQIQADESSPEGREKGDLHWRAYGQSISAYVQADVQNISVMNLKILSINQTLLGDAFGTDECGEQYLFDSVGVIPAPQGSVCDFWSGVVSTSKELLVGHCVGYGCRYQDVLAPRLRNTTVTTTIITTTDCDDEDSERLSDGALIQRRRTGMPPSILLSRRAPKRLDTARRPSASQRRTAIAPLPYGTELRSVTASTKRCCNQVVPARHRVVDAPEGRTGSRGNSGRVRLAAAEGSLVRSVELYSLCRATVPHRHRTVPVQGDAATGTLRRRHEVGGPTRRLKVNDE
nr:hypothetical protein CFP56_74120 [Quercus suber]